MLNSKAIVTLAIGKTFRERWNDLCLPNWTAYATQHGYDIVCLTESIDPSERARKRSPAWQKCLILSQNFAQQYERIVWIDADILINPTAPSVIDGVPIDQIGAVDEYATPTPELHRQNLRKLYQYWEANGIPFIRNETAQEYYKIYGLPCGFDQVVQTGLMVLSPQHHKEIFERVYFEYEDREGPWNYEMRPLSYELLKASFVHWIDPRFNYIWGNYKSLHFPFLLINPEHERAKTCLASALSDVYCLHFAGSVNEMHFAADNEELIHEDSSTSAAILPANDRYQCRTPVAFFIYARPDTTEKVFERIREVRPDRLFVIADGSDGLDDQRKCEQARAVIERVDWPCRVHTNYAEKNLGQKLRLESGLNWVFDQINQAIILEDDCLPHPSFFRFCDELLGKYSRDPEIMMISGNNFQFGQNHNGSSYYFSRYPHIWGWATWRRAWTQYDPSMMLWPKLQNEDWLNEILADDRSIQYWSYILQQNFDRKVSWDYCWLFACWIHNGLSILPSSNLVSNIGFRDDATHTQEKHRGLFANIPELEMEFPLVHPNEKEINLKADQFTEEIMYSGNVKRVFQRIRARKRTAISVR